jgi:Cu/Ag efflux pump CusA
MMNHFAHTISKVPAKIHSVAGVMVGQTDSLLDHNTDREKTARPGVNLKNAAEVIEVGEWKASVLFQDDQCFDILARLPEKLYCDIKVLKQLPIRLPSNETSARLHSNFRRNIMFKNTSKNLDLRTSVSRLACIWSTRTGLKITGGFSLAIK